MIHNRSAKKYLRRVHGMLPCSRKMKNHIMNLIRNDMISYLDERPEADYNMLVSRFGKPEAVAASYIDSVEASVILKKIYIGKWIMSAVAAVLVFIALTWSATVIYAILKTNQSNISYIETVVTTN
ncbi:MAG: hypothetical protein IKM59_02790 [Oscillospiraceae bacterium]|nr:hypothetical protein [Oscillospiraceae bacterium]